MKTMNKLRKPFNSCSSHLVVTAEWIRDSATQFHMREGYREEGGAAFDDGGGDAFEHGDDTIDGENGAPNEAVMLGGGGDGAGTGEEIQKIRIQWFIVWEYDLGEESKTEFLIF
ncbi:hypothetical protein AAHE18_10G066300 [Arachis hypogaea]